MAKLKFIDLFAGLGGFHLALEKLGCECVFASEIQPELQSLYERNFGMKCSGDINEIDITKDIPDHDILCAGFPCQPFSQAGKQQGFDDQKRRGNLFYKIWEILECKKPEFVFLENVPNLKSHDNKNTYKGEFYQFNLSSCIRQQNSLTAQFVSFNLSNLANIFYPPPKFLQ